MLIVDDDEDLRMLLREHFEGVGYQVETAADGNEGIARALRVPPDVIVLDLAMPLLDGWSTARLLRAYPTTRSVPIVACTGAPGEDAAARAVLGGCNAVVRKPCLGGEVEQAVNDLLGGAAPGGMGGESDAG